MPFRTSKIKRGSDIAKYPFLFLLTHGHTLNIIKPQKQIHENMHFLEKGASIMLAVESVNVQDNFKELCDKISMGETIVISRPRNENIYMINEAEYNALQKAKRNAEYLAMLDKSDEELKAGKVVVKTMEELEAMEN